MKYIKLEPKFQKKLDGILQHYPLVQTLTKRIDVLGGTVVLVGGAVRDLFLDLPIKDLDIEVHGITLKCLGSILSECSSVSSIGKSFGVLRVHGLDVDWSIPRTDTSGRKPKVKLDPFMGFKQAFARRDLTINAMGIDLVNKQLIDLFNGLADLKKGILRACDEKFFSEDPLRFFRVMQFIGRFGFNPDKKLNSIAQKMDISTVSRERIEVEFEKLFLKSEQPSLGIRWLERIGRLEEILPELLATKKIFQDKKWHPEGTVFEHTMQTVDAAAALKYSNDQEKLVLVYAALCHDLGKVGTTKKIAGFLKSIGHEKESEKLAKKMLKKITKNKNLMITVSKLVRNHMAPFQFIKNHAKPSEYKRLALTLEPQATIRMLGLLALADKRGRNPKKGKPLTKKFKEVDEFLMQAQEAQVLETSEKPVLLGRDLLGIVKAGPQMGLVLKKAYTIQIREGIKDKTQLKKRVLEK